MLSINNKAIIACAGSGKTTYLVKEALRLKNKRVLITTYTNENLDQIRTFFYSKESCIPSNVSIQSWFSFLLQDAVRPYQNYLTKRNRIRSVYFFSNSKEDKALKKGLMYQSEAKDEHYLTKNEYIYEDKVSKFIYKCNEQSQNRIINRLEKIYDYIFIDELQDLAGYDLNFLDMLFRSNINVLLVGDPRQATYSTNNASKNKQYKGSEIYNWLKEKEKDNKVVVVENNDCFRCNQQICDLADGLFPDLPKAVSKNLDKTGHDGIFYIKKDEVDEYIGKHNPVILRYSKKTYTMGRIAVNIGISKGRTYDRVLIFPTKTMLEYFKTKDVSKVDKTKLYVAITRARYSVAFVQ